MSSTLNVDTKDDTSEHAMKSAESLLPNPHSPDENSKTHFSLPDAPPKHPDIHTANTSKTDGSPPSSDMKNPTEKPTSTTTKNAANTPNTLSKQPPGKTATRFFSAYAETWIGLSPLWLMGEALTPGKKVGTRFFKGKDKLFAATLDLQKALSDSGKDVIVIVDEKLRNVNVKNAETTAKGKEQVGKTVEVLKAAGEHAFLIVTTSLEKIQADLTSNKSTITPQIKSSINKNGRDVILIMDKALKHPIVITGVNQFARTKGIPHADALLRLASLGLSRILRAMPETVQEEVIQETSTATNTNTNTNTTTPKFKGKSTLKKDKEYKSKATASQEDDYVIIEEMTADELERSSTQDEELEADEIERSGKGVGMPEVKEGPSEGGDPYEKMRKKTQCPIQ